MKKIIFFLFTISLCVYLPAQEAKTVFVNMPDSIAPLLTAVNRADFIDFRESNMKSEVKNKFDDTSEMTELTDSYIKIQMSEESNWQMKLLPLQNDSVIICIITTACAPVCDSHIRFFTLEWKELLVSDYIDLPRENDFYRSPVGEEQTYEYNRIREKADVFLYKAELYPDSLSITFNYTTPQYLDKEDQEKLTSYINPTINMSWSNGKFISQ